MQEDTIPPVDVPWQQLPPETLEAVIDDFILREGTDYGWVESSLEQKRADIVRQLNAKRAKIVFEPESESITLILRDPRVST